MKKIASRILLSTFIVTLFSWQQGKAQVPSQSTDVMLQAFYWNSFTDSSWKNLKTQTTEISQNFDLIWLPPSGNAVTTSSMGYLPIYYFDQTSSFGTQADLKSLIALFKTNGTRCLADIVINHRNGRYSWTDFPSETYNGVAYSWGSEAICKGDECVAQGYPATGAADTGENYAAARDIDHSNLNVQNTIKAYMSFLKNDIGYDGWRYDLVKGYSGVYNAMYNDAAGAYMSVGEYWDGSYDGVYNWIKSANYKSTAFDFPLKYAINRAFSSNNMTNLTLYNGSSIQPAGLINKDQSKKYSVTFVENHDTGASGSTSAFTGDILAANAFILSSPGIPCVYLKHWQTYKEQIKPMIAARKAAGIHSESSVVVNQTLSSIYVATATGKYGNLIVKIGSGSYTAPTGYNLVTSGTNYAIWTNVAVTVAPSLSVTPDSGVFPTGTTVTFTASGGTAPLYIYYTTDGTEPTSSSTKVSTGAKISVSGTTTVKAIAIDAAGKMTDVITKTYKSEQTNIVVKWKNDLNWTGSMYLYAWDDTNTALVGAWPGKVVTPDASGWYSYTFARDYVNVIFNNGSSKPQTVDIKNVTANTCYKINSTMTGTAYNVTSIDCGGETALDNLTNNILEIYPNPTKESVNISGIDNLTKISIYNLSGQKIKDFQLLNNSIDISDVSKGIYILYLVTHDGKSLYRKIIKE